MNNELLLLSGNDIPFAEGGISIHQPTIKEIAYISEESFFLGYEMINFSKNNLSEEDKVNLESYSDFDILLIILNEKNSSVNNSKNKLGLLMLLSLLFPQCSIEIKKDKISLIEFDNNREHAINSANFDCFKEKINSIFPFGAEKKDKYKAAGALAQKIIDKLKERERKLAKIKSEQGPSSGTILGRYVSILSVGENKDMNLLLKYTVYQLFDEFKRFELKLNFDMNLKARLAGAKDLEAAEDWMKDMYIESK